MLSDPDYFNVDNKIIGRTSSNIIFYATIAALISTFFIGYIYDIVGRRIPIMLCFFTMIILIWLLPYASSIAMLTVFRSGMQTSAQFLHSNPLLIDYVKSESRGKATAFQGIGNGFGEFIAIAVLL